MKVTFPAKKGQWGSRGCERFPDEDWDSFFSAPDPSRVSPLRRNGQPMISRERIYGEQERLLTAVLVKASRLYTKEEKERWERQRALGATLEAGERPKVELEDDPRCLWCGKRRSEVVRRVEEQDRWGFVYKRTLREPCEKSARMWRDHRWRPVECGG